MAVHWLHVVATLAAASTAHGARQQTETTVEIQAVFGGETKLPCDIQPPDSSDEVHLVIWFKEGYSSSVYSFDSRGRSLEQAEQTMDVNVLEGRAFFRYRDTPATLSIESVRSSDAGSYRCRVDFGKSPTRNTVVKLSVIVPPEKLVIMDDQGSYVLGSTPRPYNEGTMATLKCISLGGQPLPRVTWWRDNNLLDDSCEVLASDRVENTLTLEWLSHQHFLAALTCKAANNNLLAPLSRTLTLDMNLKPLQVRLLGERHPLSAGTKYKIQCEVLGSRPSPIVTWYMGSSPLTTYRVSTNPRSNITTSTLYVLPTSEDNGKMLTCRAVNPLVANSSLEDKWMLDIHYVPVAKLKLGGNKLDSIHEDSDVHFDCSIKSNPWVNSIIWKHNGKRLYNNSTLGIAVANQSLVLHSVMWERAGAYVCEAGNEEGYGESNAVNLDIKYTPFCQSPEPEVVGLSHRNGANLVCQVRANPPDVSFAWICGDTGESLEAFSSSSMQSTLFIPPGSGTTCHNFLCTSQNDVGVQKKQCLFHLILAEAPDPVTNCTVMARETGSVTVVCSEGFSGGVPQQFTMNVTQQNSRSLVTTITAQAPNFSANGIDAALALNISVYAFNSEGRSEVATLLLPAIGSNAASASVASYIAPVFGSLVGVVVILSCIVAAIVIFQHTKSRSCDAENNYYGDKPSCSTMFGVPEDQFWTIPLGEEKDNLPATIEPDVIPVKCGAYNPFISSQQ